MHVPLTLYGPSFKVGKEVPVLQNIEIYKLLIDLAGIPSDSAQLNETVMDQQFSLFGKFENVLKKPTNPPEQPNLPEPEDDTVCPDIFPRHIRKTSCGMFDTRVNVPIHMKISNEPNTGTI